MRGAVARQDHVTVRVLHGERWNLMVLAVEGHVLELQAVEHFCALGQGEHIGPGYQ